MGEMSDVLSEEGEEDGRSKFFVQPHADWGKVVHILIENDEVEIRWQSISRRTFPASSARPASPIRAVAVACCLRLYANHATWRCLTRSLCIDLLEHILFQFLKSAFYMCFSGVCDVFGGTNKLFLQKSEV